MFLRNKAFAGKVCCKVANSATVTHTVPHGQRYAGPEACQMVVLQHPVLFLAIARFWSSVPSIRGQLLPPSVYHSNEPPVMFVYVIRICTYIYVFALYHIQYIHIYLYNHIYVNIYTYNCSYSQVYKLTVVYICMYVFKGIDTQSSAPPHV